MLYKNIRYILCLARVSNLQLSCSPLSSMHLIQQPQQPNMTSRCHQFSNQNALPYMQMSIEMPEIHIYIGCSGISHKH